MIAMTEALWLRAVDAVGKRGLLPERPSSLTPRELGSEVAIRGEDRLLQLALDWYYPASYGRTRGSLSYEEAARLVAGLEAATALVETGPQIAPQAAEHPPLRKRTRGCDLCGLPIPEPTVRF